MKSYKSLISDSVFVVLISMIIWFAFRKIQSYFFLIQAMSPELQDIEQKLLANVSEFNFDALSLNLDLISQMSAKIQMIIIFAVLSVFVVFCVTQSFSFIKKLDLKYLKKFVVISVPYFVILVFLIFKILTALKEFIVPFWFENQTNTFLLITIIILIIILLMVMHIFSLTASYLVKNNIKTAVKKSFQQLKNHKLTLKFFLTAMVIIIILITAIRYFSLVLKIISLLVVLILINYYRNILPR